jgi:hypothetical protein
MNTQNEIITENLMTEEEMNQFFFDLMMTVQYDLFAMDGLTFFLNTISKLAATDSLKVQDTCDALSSLVFQNSIAFDKAQKSFGKTFITGTETPIAENRMLNFSMNLNSPLQLLQM